MTLETNYDGLDGGDSFGRWGELDGFVSLCDDKHRSTEPLFRTAGNVAGLKLLAERGLAGKRIRAHFLALEQAACA